MRTDPPAQDSPDRKPVLRSVAIALAGMAVGLLLGSLSPQRNFVSSEGTGIASRGLVPTAMAQRAARGPDITGEQHGTKPLPVSSAALDPAPGASGGLEPCWAVLTELVRC